MNKKWIVVRREYFDIGLVPNQVFDVAVPRPRNPARNQPENNIGVPQLNLDCWVFNNQNEATEWMEESLRGSPQQKFILLEMMCVYQIKPSPAVKMSWNERGELE
jgi:hypothetical protein